MIRTSLECDLDLISAAVDKELTFLEQARLDSHLAICPDCREEYQRMRNTSGLCSSLPEVSLPQDVMGEIREALAEKGRTFQPMPAQEVFWKRWFKVSQLRPAFAAGLCTILLGLVVVWMKQGESTTPISGFTLVANGQEEVAGLDLVIRYDPAVLSIGEVNLTEMNPSFLMQTSERNGTLRVSMASAQGIQLSGSTPILEIPIEVSCKIQREMFSLQSLRAYRPDGSEVSVHLETIPMLPRSNGGKDTAA
jgi:hypothetical protein